ncbi:MAG: hypothetical protein WCI27_06075, partial [Candidatus Omnitrophota bacterium]
MKNFRQVVILITLIMITSSAWAANYYVDYVGGIDTNIGTGGTIPWKHAPGDPRASGNASRTLSPGDVVWFKG